MVRRIVMIVVVVAAVSVTLASWGCGIFKGGDGGSKLTEAQRDSVLGKSGLAGTSAIGRTMATSGAEANRAAELNAQVDSLPH